MLYVCFFERPTPTACAYFDSSPGINIFINVFSFKKFKFSVYQMKTN